MCVCGRVMYGGVLIEIDDQSNEHVWLLSGWLQLYSFYLVVSHFLNFILLTFNYYSLYLLLVCKLPSELPFTTYLSDASYCDSGLVDIMLAKTKPIMVRACYQTPDQSFFL